MTKLIDCPVCKKNGQPVRDDAKVCSPNCRVRKWRADRKIKAAKLDKQAGRWLKRNCVFIDGAVYCAVSKQVKLDKQKGEGE